MGAVGSSQHYEKKKENEDTAVTDVHGYAAKAACSQSQCSRDSHRAATWERIKGRENDVEGTMHCNTSSHLTLTGDFPLSVQQYTTLLSLHSRSGQHYEQIGTHTYPAFFASPTTPCRGRKTAKAYKGSVPQDLKEEEHSGVQRR